MQKTPNEDLGRISLEEYQNSPKRPICIILDNIRSRHNVGSAFRTADAFKIQKLYLGGISPRPPHRDIHKTALGATESVDWEHQAQLSEWIPKLKNEGWTIVGIEQVKPPQYLDQFSFKPAEKYAFVFGNEVFGISDALLEHLDYCLEIPQFGTKHSLNISVSIGLVLWDHYLKLGF